MRHVIQNSSLAIFVRSVHEQIKCMVIESIRAKFVIRIDF
jgi:hypothetical protein